MIEHSSDFVDLFVERELTRPFVSFVAGVCINVDGEGHRSNPTLNCFALPKALTLIAPLSWLSQLGNNPARTRSSHGSVRAGRARLSCSRYPSWDATSP